MTNPNRGHLHALHTAAHALFGADCDLPTIYAAIGAAVGHRFGDTPAWINIIGAAGGGKTERIWPLKDTPGVVTASNISSEGALLSATSEKERSKGASGGLLREIGDDGILLLKDVTSILSMSGDRRDTVLGALREVFDGEWTRKAGVDGGSTFTWTGHCTVIGAVTEKWDSHHSVIAAMGDRFMLVRLPAETQASRKSKALASVMGRSTRPQRKHDYATALLNVVRNADTAPADLTEAEARVLVDISDQTTRLRTPAETDWKGDAAGSTIEEGIYRFLGQLQTLFLGMVAAGVDRGAALDVCRKVGRDSVPPRRIKLLEYLAENPWNTSHAVARATGIPKATTYRDMDAMLTQGLVRVASQDESSWKFGLAESVDLSCYNFGSGPLSATPLWGDSGSDPADTPNFSYMGVAESGPPKPQVTGSNNQNSGSLDDDDEAMLEALAEWDENRV